MPSTADPSTFQLGMNAGNDATFRFPIKDAAGAAANVTGASFKFTVKTAFEDAIASAKFQKQSPAGSGIDTTQAATGLIDVLIAPGDTDTLAGNYAYDLEMMLSGKTYTVALGAFVVRRRISTSGSLPVPTSALVPFPGAISVADALYLYDTPEALWHKYKNVNGVLTDVGQAANIPF